MIRSAVAATYPRSCSEGTGSGPSRENRSRTYRGPPRRARSGREQREETSWSASFHVQRRSGRRASPAQKHLVTGSAALRRGRSSGSGSTMSMSGSCMISARRRAPHTGTQLDMHEPRIARLHRYSFASGGGGAMRLATTASKPITAFRRRHLGWRRCRRRLREGEAR